MKTVGERIKFVREEKLKVNRSELAAMLGLSPATITKWEQPTFGKMIDAQHLVMLCEVTNVPVSFFMSGLADPEREKDLSRIFARLKIMDPEDYQHHKPDLDTVSERWVGKGAERRLRRVQNKG
jgi:transcriptional regulator with XRE-family HTH domain